MRILIICVAGVPLGMLIGSLAIQSRLSEADSAVAYSCGYLARSEEATPLQRETYFCKQYRQAAIAHGFTSARDAYPQEPKL